MKALKNSVSVLLVISILFCAGVNGFALSGSNKTVINVDAGKEYTKISDNLFGIFFEDINFSADGGLNANLIMNNSFEQKLAWAPDYDCRMEGWKVTEGEYELKNDNPLNDNNPTYLHAVTDALISNKGYPDAGSEYGLPLKANKEYELTFYARGNEKSALNWKIVDEKGKSISDGKADITGEFTKYTFDVKATKTADCILELNLTKGTDIDYFRLIPKDSFGYGDSTWQYTSLRTDLVEALKDLNPSFLRFPGGCLIEGAYDWDYTYNWKDTLGSVEQRVQIPNLWGYNQSREIGFYEYFCLCDYLDATPVPVVHSGLMCQGRGQWTMDIDSEEFAQHIQDVLDLIEYANGSVDTTWGKVRAENGHPEPFDMKYIAIGNENWNAEYWDRFEIIYNAVKEAYPDITIISSSGAWPGGNEYDYAWEQINEKYTDTVVDEHYYVAPWWVYDNYWRYDNYDRNSAKVFVGEYAVHRGGGEQITKNNLQVAIDEAVHMTSLVRNGDLIEMACYAPLFAREGYTQWAPDLIWYDSDSVVKTPSYYVQQLYMKNTGKAVVSSSKTGSDDIYQVVSIDEDSKQIYVTVVNSSNKSINVDINLEGFNIDKTGEQRYVGSGLYNLANRVGTLSNLVTPKYQKTSVKDDSISKSVGPHSLNIFCFSYDGENTYSGTSSDSGYKPGSQFEIKFYEGLANFITWLQSTKIYTGIENLIKG